MTERVDMKQNRVMMLFVTLLPLLVFASKASADITLTLTGLLGMGYALRSRDAHWLTWSWARAILAFAFFSMAVSPFTPFPRDAFLQSLILLRWPLAGIVLSAWVLNDPLRLERFERSSLYLVIFIIADSLLQLLWGKDIFGHPMEGDRLTGPFSKMIAGVYSLKLFFFALAYVYLRTHLKGDRALIGMTVGMMFFCVFLLFSGERVVFLLGAMFLVLWLGCAIALRPVLRLRLLAVLGVSGAGAVLLGIWQAEHIRPRVQAFLDDVSHFSESGYGKIFHSAESLWQQSPWFGIGMRQYSKLCVSEGGPTDFALASGADLCAHHPHNIYLELLAQSGLIGLVLFMVFLGLVFRDLLRKAAWRQDPMLAMILFGSVFIIFWPFASSMSINANNYAGVVWLTIAWALSRARLMSGARP